MKKFEYIMFLSDGTDVWGDKTIKELNEYGELGWELVHVEPCRYCGSRFFLKRVTEE